MQKSELNIQETKEMFLFVAEKMIGSKDVLTKADSTIGDGDHGIGMATGFEAVKVKLNGEEYASQGELSKAVGLALMMSIGGASGAIFGTLYQSAGASLTDQTAFSAKSLNTMLESGLEAVKKRGKAKVGDKTMVDALEAAAEASKTCLSATLAEALATVTEAANQGMENTKEMVATMGRARSLGKRSLGHADPGAISMALICGFMLEYVEANGSTYPVSQ